MQDCMFCINYAGWIQKNKRNALRTQKSSSRSNTSRKNSWYAEHLRTHTRKNHSRIITVYHLQKIFIIIVESMLYLAINRKTGKCRNLVLNDVFNTDYTVLMSFAFTFDNMTHFTKKKKSARIGGRNTYRW